MIRLGMLDFDTSHVVEFTRRLNHKQIDEEQFVDGAEIVVACPGESKIMPERIPTLVAEMEKLGVPLVAKPADMLGKVDGVLIEAQEGGTHLGRADRFWRPVCPATSTSRSPVPSPTPKPSSTWRRRRGCPFSARRRSATLRS